MSKTPDLVGKRFGRLIVVKRVENIRGYAGWLCKCDCGGTKKVDTYGLNCGRVRSCGCLEQENREIRKSFDEYIGKRYAHLLILEEYPTKSNEMRKVVCQCDCGNITVVQFNNLIHGHTKSCGCLKKIVKPTLKHGKTETRLYNVWSNIRERCFCSTNTSYPNYGGRGITLCDEWASDFTNFERWAFENGYDENAPYGECTLDRIDVNGNYEPSNCRWTNAKQQCNNKRNNRWITYNGETHTVAEWARKLDMNYVTLFNRLFKRNWTIEDSLTIKPKEVKKYDLYVRKS